MLRAVSSPTATRAPVEALARVAVRERPGAAPPVRAALPVAAVLPVAAARERCPATVDKAAASSARAVPRARMLRRAVRLAERLLGSESERRALVQVSLQDVVATTAPRPVATLLGCHDAIRLGPGRETSRHAVCSCRRRCAVEFAFWRWHWW